MATEVIDTTATEIVLAEQPSVPAVAPRATLSAETLADLVLSGDMKGLTPAQKVEYYRARCEAAGLDPRTQPFEYIVLKGKERLYATKACTDQLAGLHRLQVAITDREVRDGVCVAQCRVTWPDGRTVDDIGVVAVGSLKGEELANALMKAVTKAKRRTILSACGLGMLDESELDTIEGHYGREALTHDIDTGEVREIRPDRQQRRPSPEGGSPETDRAFNAWMKSFLEKVNADWDEYWSNRTDVDGRAVPNEFLNHFRLKGHLLKFYEAGEGYRSQQGVRFLSARYAEDPAAIAGEATRYARKVWAQVRAKVLKDAGADDEPESDVDEDVPPIEPGDEDDIRASEGGNDD